MRSGAHLRGALDPRPDAMPPTIQYTSLNPFNLISNLFFDISLSFLMLLLHVHCNVFCLKGIDVQYIHGHLSWLK